MSELTEPFSMTEMLRREYVKGSVDSVKFLRNLVMTRRIRAMYTILFLYLNLQKWR